MRLRVSLFILSLALSTTAWAGGSGLNEVIVVNQNSTNSVQLGNDYCEQRGVPPQNLFRMTGWTGGSVSWTRTEFETYLRQPLLAMLANSGLTNQVQYVLLSMDIPYRVEEGGSGCGTTSALFYGFKTNSAPPPGNPATCSLPDYSSNSYAFSETVFPDAPPNTADTNSFLAFMLTDDTLADAQRVLARAVAGDSSFPTQTVYLEKTSDPARNVRFFSFDNAIFDSRVRGDLNVVRTNSDFTGYSGARGLQTGFANLGFPADAFVAGGFGDSLTSFAGDLFEGTGQTPLLVFLNAGAAASYGTVIEPCNYQQKFPDPLVFFYQRRGFSLAEAYYQSLLNPYQGVLVGEPLCAPFAQPGTATWPALTNGTVLGGQALLPPALFSAAATNLPVGQVDLFIDGRLARALTNIAPRAGDLLSVMLNGSNVQYTVPEGSTLASVTAALADALNSQSNLTGVAVFPTGDRLELQSLHRAIAGANLLVGASVTSSNSFPPTVELTAGRPGFLDSAALGYHGLTVSNSMVQGDWLELLVIKTNGAQLSLGVTNATADTNVADLCRSLMNAVNAEPALQGPDGILASDLYPDVNLAQFFLYARSAGWDGAQVQVSLTASTDLVVMPPGTNTLEDNLLDLRPRNHLYVSSGLAELAVPFMLDTTHLPDGFHDLTLVGYEGTSVRTQTRVSRTIQVRNTSLSASLSPEISGANVTLDTPLHISVSANTNSVATIEIFSTGGSIGVVSNQSSSSFPVPMALLGPGLHPFYAVITDMFGNQFRTQTTAIRIIPSFEVSISTQPLALSWPAIARLSYHVLASTSLSGPFTVAAIVTPSGTTAQWLVPGPASTQMFFRVQLAP